jgi:enamine deaminase RidA (YjgF/YER057c/UK114 family)
MPDRQRVATATPWATVVGYSRAVRAGNIVHVSGTTSVDDDGNVLHPGDPYRQAQRCFEIIVRALRELGAEPAHVVRTRMYVRDATQWKEIGKAHGEVFGTALPATTLVEVAALVDPDMLVEIEAEAIIGEP